MVVDDAVFPKWGSDNKFKTNAPNGFRRRRDEKYEKQRGERSSRSMKRTAQAEFTERRVLSSRWGSRRCCRLTGTTSEHLPEIRAGTGGDAFLQATVHVYALGA